jgi:hypothetical protein
MSRYLQSCESRQRYGYFCDRECDIVEILHMRLTLLQMTFGKHIERKHICFFPGEVRTVQYLFPAVKNTHGFGCNLE